MASQNCLANCCSTALSLATNTSRAALAPIAASSASVTPGADAAKAALSVSHAGHFNAGCKDESAAALVCGSL